MVDLKDGIKITLIFEGGMDNDFNDVFTVSSKYNGFKSALKERVKFV